MNALKKPDLTALRQRLQTAQALGVTIEPGRIAVDLVRRNETGVRTVRSFALPITVEALLANPEAAGAEFSTQLLAGNIRERKCAVCIPPGWALTAPTDVPAMSAEDLRSYLELRAERDFPIAPSELRLAHCAFNLPDGTRAATLAGAPVKKLDAIERMLTKAGCRVVSISLGLDRCLASNGSTGALHFLAGPDAVDLVTVSGGGVAARRTLVARDDATALFPEVRISLGRLPEALRAGIHSATFEGGAEAAARLFAGLQAPLQRAGIASALASDEIVGRAGALAAERWLRKAPAAFEFVAPKVNPWQQKIRQFDSGRRRWIIAAAAGIVLLPILAFLIRSSMESGLNDEWNAMRNNVADLETIQQKIRQFRPWFDQSPTSVAILESLAAAFPDAGDVWAKSIEINDDSKVTCTGFARNTAALTNMREALRRRPGVAGLQVQQVRGENPVQFTLVYKWVRP